MSIFTKKNGKTVIHRSIYIKILIFGCLIGASAVILQPVQTALGIITRNIQAALIEKIEDFTGMDIHYSSIRPAFTGSVDIREIKFFKNEKEILSVSRARFYFSVRELLFDKKIFIHTIQIDRPVLRMNLQDIDDFAFLSSISGSRESSADIMKQITEILPENTDYKINNCFISISDGGCAIQLTGMDIELIKYENDIYLDLNFNMEINFTNLLDRELTVKTQAGIKGSYSAGLHEGSAQAAISSLSLSQRFSAKETVSFSEELVRFSPMPVNLLYKDNKVTLTPPAHDSGNNYLFSYDTQTQSVFTQIECNDFVPDSFIRLSDSVNSLGRLLNIPVTGNFLLEYEKDKKLNYNVNFHGGNLSRYGQTNASPLTDAFLISVYGSDKRVVVEDFCLNICEQTAKAGFFQGIVSYSGSLALDPFIPSGNISLGSISLTGTESVNASFEVTGNTELIQLFGENVAVGLSLFKSIDVYLYPSDRDIGINVTGISDNGGSVYLDAVMNTKPAQADASLILDSFSIYNLAEVIRPFADIIKLPPDIDYLSDTLIDAEIFFATDFSNLVYNAPNISVKREDTLGILSFSGTDRQLSLSEGFFYIGENIFTVHANADFSNPADLDFSLNANYLDLSWNIQGQIIDRTTLIIRDPNGLHLYGGRSNTGIISGYIEAIDFPFLLNANPVYLNFYITLRYNSIDFWSLDVAQFEGRDLRSNFFILSGAADQDGASFRDIIYNDESGMLLGSADFSWNTDFSYLQFIISLTDGIENGELYSLEGMLRNDHISVNAFVSNMRLNRFINFDNTIIASGEVDINWNSVESFKIKANLTSFYGVLQPGRIARGAGVMEFSNDELILSDLYFDWLGLKTTAPLIYVNHKKGIVNGEASFQGYALERNIQGEIGINAGFKAFNSWLNIEQALELFEGELKIENILFGDLSQDKIAFIFEGHEGSVSVYGRMGDYPGDMIKLEMDKEGNFYLGLSSPFPIRSSIAGTLTGGMLDAHCNYFFIDMAPLYNLASNDHSEFSIIGGYITGTIDIRGPVGNPEFFGTGKGSSFRMLVPNYLKSELRPLPFDIIAEGYEMAFGPELTVSGSGAGMVSGFFRFEYWTPRNIGIDINIPRESPIPYGLDAGGFIAEGDASGTINLLVDFDEKLVEFKGDLLMNNSELGLNMDEIISHEEMFISPDHWNTVLELTVTTGPMVDFFWPNKNTPIIRANPVMGTKVLFTLDTQSMQYSLTSDINLRSGELYYLDRNFYIREGTIVFRENETQMNPLLTARAEIRDRAESGPVTISMIIENQPLLSFEPRFESTPGLTQLEIYSILGQNITGLDGSDNTEAVQRLLMTSSADIVAQLIASSDIFSQFALLRRFERQARTFLRLDMLSVRTRILQNAIVTAAVPTPVDRTTSVGNYFDNTTVFIGKYIGQDMFLQGMLTMKYDENRPNFGGLTIEPEIGIEMRTPYLNIRWDFFPRTPQTWWASDNSITLIWSKSF